jgi:hypothetical protein
MSTSVFAILLLAGLMALPKEPIEAARVDGCNAWQVFKHITLPFLMPFVYIAMTIRSLDVARAYDMVRIMTNGGPAGRTELLWTLMTRVGYAELADGHGERHGLHLDPALHRLHRLLLSQAVGRTRLHGRRRNEAARGIEAAGSAGRSVSACSSPC